MNRRNFLKRIFAAAGAVAVGPVALKVAAELLPSTPGINPAWVNAPYEAEFLIPSQEVIDNLCLRTAWYWHEESLKNLMDGVRKIAI